MKCFKMHYLIKVNKKNQWMYNIVLFSARINENKMKQTAVEWAINEIQSNWYDYEYGDLDMDDVIEQAKQMEKEQSECICVNVIDRILYDGEQGKEINSKQIFEDVYNETFNKSIKNKG